MESFFENFKSINKGMSNMSITQWVFVGILISLLLLSFITFFVRRSFYKKNKIYALKKSSLNQTGSQVAISILKNNNINNTVISNCKEGKDKFDEKNNVIFLSPSIHNSSSVTAITKSAYFAGSAIESEKNNVFVKFKKSVREPVLHIKKVRRIFIILLFSGFIAAHFNNTIIYYLLIAATVAYAIISLFYLLVLIVETSSHKIAKRELNNLYTKISDDERKGINEILDSSYMNYIITFVSSIFLLVFLIGRLLIASILTSGLLIVVYIVRILVLYLSRVYK